MHRILVNGTGSVKIKEQHVPIPTEFFDSMLPFWQKCYISLRKSLQQGAAVTTVDNDDKYFIIFL